jgi:hypothetical protein
MSEDILHSNICSYRNHEIFKEDVGGSGKHFNSGKKNQCTQVDGQIEAKNNMLGVGS